MASIFTKKVVKTYSRQKRSLYDEEAPTKRRRVACALETTEAETTAVYTAGAPIDASINMVESSEPPTSSPKNSPAVWSDEAPRSSPPSSPIPHSSPPPLQKRRAVFSFLRKTIKPTPTAKPPLSERSHNAQSPPRPPPAKAKRMVQMQLDLASETRKACKICGMEYIPSNAEDAALHRKFHAMNVGGVDFTKAIVERLRKKQVWSGGDGSFIAVIGRKDALALRTRTSDVLKVVNTDLAAVPISDEELWSQTSLLDKEPARAKNSCTPEVAKSKSKSASVDRFKTYLYIRGQKCIGACLAERIWEAFTVLSQEDASAETRQLPSENKSSSISISIDTTPAMLGISRIWTSNQHRKQGIASRLLDCARSDFLYGLTVEKEMTAFSQPTESGGNLARRWFGSEAGLEHVNAPPPKTKKHVRIESSTTYIPPHPADEPDDSPHGARAPPLNQSESAQPRPPVHSASTSNSEAFTSKSSIQTAGWGSETTTADMWATSPRVYQPPQSAISPGGTPANPFSRTLASIEPQQSRGEEDRTVTERAASGNNRASLDVESFKNLLMTGKAGPRQSGPPSQTVPLSSIPSGVQFESSSSTDTSSISRQSIFEHAQETHHESPRTSYEMAESDEDNMGLVSEVKKGKKKPPPAPKHRHGKLVTPRQPQIVSFESFSATEPAPAPITRSRDNSDVNKPLPPTPVILPPPLHISTQDDTPQRPITMQQQSSDSLATSEAPRPQKKTPPPVPLARRQSQLRTSSNESRSRSNSNLTLSSQLSVDAGLQSPVPSNKDVLSVAKSPPPPPRSRHGARLTDLSTSSANSSTTELPQRSASVRTATSSQGASISRRSTLESENVSSAPGVHRSSSIASNRTAQRAVSGESTGSTMAPPPPPPRRRQSTRSSLDQPRPYIPSSSPTESRRTSTENRRTSVDSKRRTSMASESSLRNEYAPADEKGGNEYALYSPNEEAENKLGLDAVPTEAGSDPNNILDDMEKFQREIEELRQRYTKAA
ncbi:hypothetical protein CC86DRAFT_445285 [Ophiobolus disseminans]|uniref:Uncharacterized protein n=1 Tax=Ophiobolus disseminans TaxID=1469910 RepID=A0A6A7A2C7_9PLEO|nr:hypothetical protein CC86DRAFT_445285 [Ophiobolus disseminans]